MVKPITTYVTQNRLSLYGHVMRRDNKNVAKEISLTPMTMGGKRPRLRWMDRVSSDLRQHQLDPKLAQNGEAWGKRSHGDRPRKGISSAKVSKCRK